MLTSPSRLPDRAWARQPPWLGSWGTSADHSCCGMQRPLRFEGKLNDSLAGRQAQPCVPPCGCHGPSGVEAVQTMMPLPYIQHTGEHHGIGRLQCGKHVTW